MTSCAMINVLLPVGFQVEPALSWTGSPASYSARRSHSTVDLKKHSKVNLLRKTSRLKIYLFISIYSTQTCLWVHSPGAKILYVPNGYA